jgi:hypothetical protein
MYGAPDSVAHIKAKGDGRIFCFIHDFQFLALPDVGNCEQQIGLNLIVAENRASPASLIFDGQLPRTWQDST